MVGDGGGESIRINWDGERQGDEDIAWSESISSKWKDLTDICTVGEWFTRTIQHAVTKSPTSIS